MAGHFYPVVPRRLKPGRGASDWVFAHYHEFPTQREDGLDFHAYLFRNVGRTVFGAEVSPSRIDPRDWATKVITDAEFRTRKLTVDPFFIELWHHH